MADTDNHVIREVVVATGVTTTVAGQPGSPGDADGVGSAARFNEPRGLATDGSYLYVVDFGSHTVRQIELGTWVVATLAGAPGSPGDTDGVGSAARFNYPRGIAVKGAEIFVADTGNHTIRLLHLLTHHVTTIAGLAGQPGSADGLGGAARFSSPRGIAVDAESLYVADSGNHVIRQLLRSSWDVTTLCGQAGTPGSTPGLGPAATFDTPWGILVRPNLAPPFEQMYVIDSGSHVVRMVN